MKERIAEFVHEKAYKPMTFAELATALGLAEKQHPQLKKTLQQMEATGEVVRTRTDCYGAPERMNLAVGRLQGHPKGFGFLVSDDPGADDIYIGREALNGAWHGDRIVARLSPPTRAGGRVEGEVIRILQRANQRVVGTFETSKHSAYVTPDDRRLPDDIIIPKGATNGAKSGEKVVVQIVEFTEARRIAEGRIVERLGMKGQVGVDIVSVIRKFGLPEAFPPRVLKEAEEIPEEVPAAVITDEGRRDLRDWTIITIDGADAKDLDDAVSVQMVGEGLWRLGVHIADVSYYVKEGSALDQEAYKRGTSVYLADRVVPMLPPRLSNGICSLNPRVERLTVSCVMEINREGKILRYDMHPSVIKTTARMTYTEVNGILAGDAELSQKYEPLVPVLQAMQALMGVLREKRIRRGALDFDLPEAKVKLNDEGWPVEIRRVDRGVSERIIEEFMLAANETVAEHCQTREVPFMFRVHGEPAPDRIAALHEFLALFGYTLKVPRDGSITPKMLQAVTDWSHGRPEENLINSVLLRTMRQAIYSEENLGHFGLAADFYCHFTSPIRRYPDLVVHRVLRAMLLGPLGGKLQHKWETWMPEAARNSSDRERLAVEAERETIELKKAEFMSDKVGEAFDGIISGVSQFGFFVQLPNTVEGLVHVSTLTDDYYHFHEKFYALIGERTRRRFRLGDPVVVRLTRVDVENRQLDFGVDLDQTALDVALDVPQETRARAPKKRAAAAPSQPRRPVAAQLAGSAEKTGRKRKRRRGKRPLEQGRDTDTAELLSTQSGMPAGPSSPKPSAAQVPAPPPQVPKARSTASKQAPAPAAPKQAPVAQLPPPESKPPAAQPPAAEKRVPKARPSRSSKVDMWGVPVPAGRPPRTRTEEDPGVVNPFSLNPPKNDRRDNRLTEAPVPATAGEPGAAAPTEGARRTKVGARRPSRPRGGSAGAPTPNTPTE